jgi:hypothetical protein
MSLCIYRGPGCVFLLCAYASKGPEERPCRYVVKTNPALPPYAKSATRAKSKQNSHNFGFPCPLQNITTFSRHQLSRRSPASGRFFRALKRWKYILGFLFCARGATIVYDSEKIREWKIDFSFADFSR